MEQNWLFPSSYYLHLHLLVEHLVEETKSVELEKSDMQSREKLELNSMLTFFVPRPSNARKVIKYSKNERHSQIAKKMTAVEKDW